jgi:hypothetical protein
MAYTVVNASSLPVLATETTLYTVPAAKFFIIASLNIVNQAAATDEVTIAIADANPATAAEIIFNGQIQQFYPRQVSAQALTAGKLLTVTSTTGTTSFVLTGFLS